MAICDKKLEDQLKKAGNSLFDPPRSPEELLCILAQIEDILSNVEQSPSKSMRNAMAPSLKALVADRLFSHSNVDVRVAVASCLSEIMRITAPDAPFDDDQMKVIFELIVSTFENLADKSSYSYDKRISILQTTAKVQSCVVMLDLECDALIVEMFQHFLKTIRDYHPDTVASDMETIMTLVLEESEELSPEMLSPILARLKKDNGEVLAVSKKLAEKVLQNTAAKVKPSIVEAVKSSGLSFDDYSSVVASICGEASSGGNLEVVTEEDVMGKAVPTQIAQEAGSVKSDVKEDSIADLVSAKIQGHGDVIVQCRNIDRSVDVNSVGLCHEQIKPPETSLVDGDKEAETPKEKENNDQILSVPPCETPSAKLVTSSENGKDTNVQQKTESLVKEVKSSADNVSEHAYGGVAKTSIAPDTSNKSKGTNGTSSLKEKSNKLPIKEVDADSDDGEESLKQMLEKEKLRRRKAAAEKQASKTSAKDDAKKNVSSQKVASKSSKYEHCSEETPKTSSKRKRKPATENASDIEESGENLVGLRIKVWWPLDRAFYVGVVDSYDSEKKKHLVLYEDGDQEILNLKRERWDVIDSKPKLEEEEVADPKTSHGPSEMQPKNKKAKKNGDQSTKGSKIDHSAKRGSMNSKAGPSKPGKKQEDMMGGIGTKLVALASRLTGKSKNDGLSEENDAGSSKSSSKSKQKTTQKNDGFSKGIDAGGSKSSSKSKQKTTQKNDGLSKENDAGDSKSSSKSKQKTIQKNDGLSKENDAGGSKSSSKSKQKTTQKNDGLSKENDAGGSKSSSKSKQKTTQKTSEPEQDSENASSDTKGKSKTNALGKSNSSQPKQTQKSPTTSTASEPEAGKGKSGRKRKRQRS